MAAAKYLPTLRDQKAAQSFQDRQTRQEGGLKKFAGAKATTKKKPKHK
jgi:hypothetical protein